MGKIRLPEWIVELPDGPHKKDTIRHFKRERRKEYRLDYGK